MISQSVLVRESPPARKGLRREKATLKNKVHAGDADGQHRTVTIKIAAATAVRAPAQTATVQVMTPS